MVFFRFRTYTPTSNPNQTATLHKELLFIQSQDLSQDFKNECPRLAFMKTVITVKTCAYNFNDNSIDGMC